LGFYSSGSLKIIANQLKEDNAQTRLTCLMQFVAYELVSDFEIHSSHTQFYIQCLPWTSAYGSGTWSCRQISP
jgi:hypothetical protein